MVIAIMAGVALFVVIALTVWHMAGFSVRLRRLGVAVREGRAVDVVPLLRAMEARYHGRLDLHILLGQALMQTGEYRQAVREWDLAQLLNRHERERAVAEIAGPLADCHIALGEWREAQGALLVALKACPEENRLQERLADVYLHRGMPRHAVGCYETALRIDKDNKALLLRLATVQEIAGDMRGALASALHVIRLEAHNRIALEMAARLYGGFGNHRSAEEHYRTLLALPGGTGTAALGLAASIEAQGGRREDALAAHERALGVVTAKADRLETLYRIGTLRLQGQEIEQAVAAFERIGELEPGYRDTAALLGEYGKRESGDRMAAYLHGRSGEFGDLVAKLLAGLAITAIREKTVRKRDLVVHGTIENGQRRDLVLVYFSRSPSALGNRELQEISDELRIVKARRAYVLCTGGFSEAASAFAATRPLSLIGRDELSAMLGVAEQYAYEREAVLAV